MAEMALKKLCFSRSPAWPKLKEQVTAVVMLFTATNKMRRGAPGVVGQCFEGSQRVNPNDRRVGSQRSVRDCAQRGAAVGAPEFAQLHGAALELRESLPG